MDKKDKNRDILPASALQVMEGIEQPCQINADSLKKLRARKHKVYSVQELVEGIFAGNLSLIHI